MRILIVDDEKNIRESLKKYLGLEGIEAEVAATAEEALESLGTESFDAVVLDLKLPGMSGQEALEQIQQRGIFVPALMISAHGQIADAVAALKAGARDYLVKPFDPAELIIKLQAVVENRRRENTLEAAKRTVTPGTGLVGESPVMRRLSAQIDKIAATDVTVLITGESGTGKEVVAREIHARSPRAGSGEPFVAVNIGGIHEGLMESELFGHEKGSFTGAAARKQGLFELAGRGSIFLDEVGEMPMALQVKLLRVLQERKVRRLGGTGDIPINARIISATNRDLEAFIQEGRFREDLYYRLNVFRLSLPPLRERREDIPLLTDHLLSRLCARMGRTRPTLAPGVMDKLMAYPFPGNIRELDNILERALIYCDNNLVRPEDIDLHEPLPPRPPVSPEEPPAPGPSAAGAGSVSAGAAAGAAAPATAPAAASAVDSTSTSMEDIEKRAIMETLARCDGNRTQAAKMLGISRKTLLSKIRSYGE